MMHLRIQAMLRDFPVVACVRALATSISQGPRAYLAVGDLHIQQQIDLIERSGQRHYEAVFQVWLNRSTLPLVCAR